MVGILEIIVEDFSLLWLILYIPLYVVGVGIAYIHEDKRWKIVVKIKEKNLKKIHV